MKKSSTFRYLPVFICLFFIIPPATAKEQTYTIAVVPQFATPQVYRDWTPLLTKLEAATSFHFKLKVYEKFSQFESDFTNGVPDLVYLNPYHMIVAHKKQRYRPILRDNANLSGILVTRKDSAINEVADLQGKSIAFPAPNAFGATLYICALLTEKFHIKFTPVYVHGHMNVYRQVILGDVNAGGGVNKTLGKEDEGIQSQLKVIFNTPETASHPIAAHPRVSIAASNKIVTALLALAQNPATQQLLDAVQLPHPVKADYKQDYADLSKLKLERYAVTEKK
jgi:phosphonate transport system substrate-binding protein